MTAPQADGADRTTRDPNSSRGLLSALPGLAILLLVGLLIRLTFAYVVLPNSGFESDLGTFTAWALSLSERGAATFYATAGFADYPPGYLYVLWLVGGIGHLLAPLANTTAEGATAALIKLPPIFADVAVTTILYFLVRSWRSARADGSRVALFAAALYLLNPISVYDSAIWGQTDAFGALITLLTVAALVRGNSEGASALAVVAALIKPQFGIVLLPLVGIVLLRRHLIRPESGPRNRVLLPASLRPWFETEHGAWRLVSSAAAAMAVLLLVIAPFSLDVFSFVRQMQKTAAGYPYLSVNAYNPWALLGSGGRPPLALGGGWSEDTIAFLGPIPAVVIGGLLLALGFVAGVARASWRDDRRSVVVVGIFLALAFFILPTRVHERYMFPIFGLLPLLAAVDRRWLLALVGLSVAAFINFHGVLTTPLYATPNLEHLPLGDLFRQTPAVVTSVLLHIVGFGFVIWQMRPRAAEERDPYADAVGGPVVGKVGPATMPESAVDGPVLVESSVVPPPAFSEPSSTTEAEAYEAPAREPVVVFLSRNFRSIVGSNSSRRDRSALLVGESGGRLDRRDLLLVLAVLVATLLLRTYRLEVPYGMHFDEVYHARTGMEFLQDWEYDMPHGIYEYTHPHLAKYAMAWGIQLLGNNRVVDTKDLGVPVTAAAVERRWAPSDDVNADYGDRMYVLSDSDVIAYDLATKLPVASIPGSYVAIAVDQGAHVVYLAAADGSISSFETTALDEFSTAAPGEVTAELLATVTGVAGEINHLAIANNVLVATSTGGTIIAVDPDTGSEDARATFPDPTAVIGINGRSIVVVDPAEVTDSGALARRLGALIDRTPNAIQAAINSSTTAVPVAGFISKKAAEDLQKARDNGELPGVSVESRDALAISLSTGVVLLDAESLHELAFMGTFAPVTGMALVERGLEQPNLFAAAGDQMVTVALPTDDAARITSTFDMPGDVQDVYWNSATTYVHVLGEAQDGSGPTVYVLEPRANPPSIFADARLNSRPQAVVLDVQQDRPAEDRDDLLALDSNGGVEVVDVGNNQFAYRFPGVVVGSLMAACLYLLARFLFNRRSIAVIVSLLALVDGMMFANARIAMNDTYVSFFIVAAFTLFVPVWLGRWRGPLVVAGALLGVGLLLGLALSSKWVGLYAMGAIGLLILLRSALGRVLALLTMVALTSVLGYLAVTASATIASPQLNFPFLALMLTLTVLLAIGMALRPVRLTLDELRLAIVAPVVAGMAVAAFGLYRLFNASGEVTTGQLLTPTRLVALGLTLIGLGVVVLVVAWLAGRYGHGPLARRREVAPDEIPAAPPPERGWLRPGSGFLGLPWLLALASILLIPLVVYVISYIPWIDLGNQWFAGFPADHHGQTFLDLQRSIYNYHNDLREAHPASSPWWAWPFDLKPVWFEQTGYVGDTTAVIYDTGNLVNFWLAIPAVAWVSYMAWKRRSLALTVVVIAIASLWLPWARIDRATFQYHVFTTLPFSFMALAYFLAELWHGPSSRTWALARIGAALAIIGAPLLWLLRLPLCGLARTQVVNPGTEVCAALSRQMTLSDIQVLGVVLAIFGLLGAAAIFVLRFGDAFEQPTWRPLLMPIFFSLALLGAAIIVIGAGLRGNTVFQMTVSAELPAFGALVLLLVPAYFVLRAEDPKRYVIAAVGAAVMWFVAFYPNIASLPVPTALSQIHLGLLPTWNWGFQFAVNRDEAYHGPLDPVVIGVLAVATLGLCLAAVYAVRNWRAGPQPDSTVSPLPEAG